MVWLLVVRMLQEWMNASQLVSKSRHYWKKNNNENNNNIGPTFVCSFYFQDQATVYSGVETENNRNKNKRKRKSLVFELTSTLLHCSLFIQILKILGPFELPGLLNDGPCRFLNWLIPFHSQEVIGNSPDCLPYNSYDVNIENLVLDQLIIL